MTKATMVVMGALALSACSSKEAEPGKEQAASSAKGAAPPAAAVDPCALFTRDEAQGIVGGPVDEPRRDEPVPGRVMACSYAASSEGSYAIVIVQVQQGTVTSLDQDLELWKSAHEGAVEIERLEVAGVPAAWLPGSRDLRAFKGGWLVIVSATKTKDERASAIAILEKVLARLPG
jgi:hypothetical protein